ncbi:MAG TPA: DUF6062 family protein [Kouleothrix sp.]|nr:DUF6062 family protein [Kouleothrix sp.]
MSTDPRTRDDLLSAMRQGCPLCVLVERAERKAIDHFLYDQVNDIRQRDALRASRGMCLPHTEMLAQGRSALGVAILSRDILRTMTAELEAEAAGRKERESAVANPLALFASLGAQVGQKLADRIGPQASCSMCAERPRLEAPLIAGLLHNLRDAAFAAAFGGSGSSPQSMSQVSWSLCGGSLTKTSPSTSVLPSGIINRPSEPCLQSLSTVRPRKNCLVNWLCVSASHTFCGVVRT